MIQQNLCHKNKVEAKSEKSGSFRLCLDDPLLDQPPFSLLNEEGRPIQKGLQILFSSLSQTVECGKDLDLLTSTTYRIGFPTGTTDIVVDCEIKEDLRKFPRFKIIRLHKHSKVP
ncbi:hypothetical protein RB195_001355 [Necator americanus]|uniref:Uncharacterized protein n=1 Tax=Necator americanus TaxID=51031 RepID=A0ABR1DDW7_NECAM